jgi:hypothetical protein
MRRASSSRTLAAWVRRLVAAVTVTVAASVVLPSLAAAGTYDVYVCPNQAGSNNAMAFSASTNHISSAVWCNGEGGSRGVQVWSNSSVSGAQAGAWWFYPPSGTTITGISSSGEFSAFDGWISNWATNMNGSGDPYGGSIDCNGSPCDEESLADSYASVPNATLLGFGIWCHASSCPANDSSSWFGPAASANVYDATITVNDPNPPTFGSDGGTIAGDSPTWISAANAPSGGWSLTTQASDPGGVCSVQVSIGGQQATGGNSADYTKAAPCGGGAGATLNLNPCALSDGQYTISESATNPAGMTGYGPMNGQVVRIDCTPPTTSIASAPSSSRWYSSAQQVVFTGSDNYSGVAELVCNDGQHPGASYTEAVSAQGTNTVSCYAVDNGSNVGNTASATVNLDYQTPTVSFSGVSSTGWVSGTQSLTVTGAEAQQLSGIASTSCQLDGGAATATNGAKQAVTITGNGTHTITCTATTGAGVTSSPASYTVHIDSTPPTLQFSGRPDQGTWYRTAQTITVSAQDQPGLSGLKEIQCTLGGATNTYTTSSVQITVQPPGGQLICKAEDNAGNWSATQAWQFLIDDTPPTGQFLPASPSSPTLAQVELADSGSGVAGATIEIQTAGGWQPLDTTWDPTSGIASAAIPDNGSLPDGSHALEALAWDVAGNEATITQGPTAGPETVTLPLRIVTALDVGAGQVLNRKCTTYRRITRKAGSKSGPFRAAAARLVRICRLDPAPRFASDLRLHYGQEQTLNGQLKTQDGSPLADATLMVTATAPGWPARTLGQTTTATDGRFSYTVDGIASETVTFTYQGTDTLRTTVGTALLHVIGRARISVARQAIAGHELRISGRVLGGYIPAGGVLVQLQYRVRGVPVGWAPFHGLIHTDRRGRFSVEFPVNAAASGYTYLFRADIDRQNGWPFLTTTTNAVARSVR